MFVPQPPRLSALPLQPVEQLTTFHRWYSIFEGWKGSSTHDSAPERAGKGDKDDPAAEASAAGMEERYVNEGIPDATKSQGTTERGGRKHGKKAKEEHPNAPEPIIGMNDERAEVSPFAYI